MFVNKHFVDFNKESLDLPVVSWYNKIKSVNILTES